MAGNRGTETTFELTTIERLEQLGYQHHIGLGIERSHDEVVLKNLLHDWLSHRLALSSIGSLIVIPIFPTKH